MKPETGCATITRAFEAHDVDTTSFRHTEHVRVAFDLLQKYDFIDATAIYAKGVRTIATNAGSAEKFNVTITYAFMSLIAERLAHSPDLDFDGFVANNTDLMTKSALNKWYDQDRLYSPVARAVFLLPDARP